MTNSLKVMNKSTQRMLRLINQLLEFRKMQTTNWPFLWKKQMSWASFMRYF